jgi:four helix bundle protein
MASATSFEDLNCWKIATELRREIGMVIKTFPSDERYELVSQIRRASRSVTNNLAEGSGRYNYKEYIRFCRISRASLNEVLDHLIIATDEKYINAGQLAAFRSKIEKTRALINGFISYLQKQDGSRVAEPIENYAIADSTTNYKIN